MRLTLDWDTVEDKQEQFERAKRAAESNGSDWELRRSSSGEGFHFVGYGVGNDTRNGFQNMMNLREAFEDDPKRLRLDRTRWAEGSPFMQVLFRRKYMARDEWPGEDGYRTGNAVDYADGTKVAPENERIKENGRLNYARILRLLREDYTQKEIAEKTHLKTYAKEDGGISRSTVSRYEREGEVRSKSLRRWLRRQARSRGIGHYADDGKGGKAADDVRYIDPENSRRTLVEYVDIPWDEPQAVIDKYLEEKDVDLEYALCNIHTGTFNQNHSDRQLRTIHNEVTQRTLSLLSPSLQVKNSEIKLNAEQKNTHFDVSTWEREPDSINYEHEPLDDGEADVYLGNLPSHYDKPDEPGKFPIFEVIVWDPEMKGMEWHVIGMWTGETVDNALILHDSM